MVKGWNLEEINHTLPTYVNSELEENCKQSSNPITPLPTRKGVRFSSLLAELSSWTALFILCTSSQWFILYNIQGFSRKLSCTMCGIRDKHLVKTVREERKFSLCWRKSIFHLLMLCVCTHSYAQWKLIPIVIVWYCRCDRDLIVFFQCQIFGIVFFQWITTDLTMSMCQ